MLGLALSPIATDRRERHRLAIMLAHLAHRRVVRLLLGSSFWISGRHPRGKLLNERLALVERQAKTFGCGEQVGRLRAVASWPLANVRPCPLPTAVDASCLFGVGDAVKHQTALTTHAVLVILQ